MRKLSWGIFAVISGISIFVVVTQVPSFARGLALSITLATLGAIALVWIVVGAVGAKLGANARKRADYFAHCGVDGTATLTSLEDTGVTINENPRVRMQFNIEVPGRSVYQVEKTQTISRVAIGMVQVGRAYPCKVDPEKPADILVSWTGQPPTRVDRVVPEPPAMDRGMAQRP